MAHASTKHSVIYLSDAHLFFGGYGKAKKERTLRRLENALSNHELVVLNGDIFELPFSNHGFSRTVARAIAVLDLVLHDYPETQVHYIIGNHDADPVFIAELKALTERHPNFHVSEKYLMLDNRLATHGDLVDYGQLERETPYFPPQRSMRSIVSNVASVIQAAGDRKAAARVPVSEWARRTAAHLPRIFAEEYAKAVEIITGHTHAPGEFELDGKLHVNSGSMFSKEDYHPVIREVSEKAWAEYLSRPQVEVVSEEVSKGPRAQEVIDREQRAFGKIHRYLSKSEEKLEKIQRKPGSFVERVTRVAECISRA